MSDSSQGSLFDDSVPRDRPTSAIANIDGGSRGNPGPAAFGAYITLPDRPAVEVKGFIPHCTNNVAEYAGCSPRSAGPSSAASKLPHVRRIPNCWSSS